MKRIARTTTGWQVAALASAALWATAAVGQGVPVADPFDQVRTTAYTYRADGELLTETVEPGNAQLCLVQTYAYDGYGNRLGAALANCTGASGNALFAPRSSGSQYGAQSVTVAGVGVTIPPGTFATSGTNELSQTEIRVYDPRFGTVIGMTGPNGLSTSWLLDDFGRKVREQRIDGTSTVTFFCTLPGKGLDDQLSANSAGCAGLAYAGGEVPADAVSLAHSEAHDTSDAKNGPFARAYLDRVGRRIRSVSEAFDGADQSGGVSRLIVQDTEYNAYGAQVLSTQPYFLDTGASVETPSGSGYGMTASEYDALGRVVATYTVDVANGHSQGGSTSHLFSGRGTWQAARTTVQYLAFTTVTTNDDGAARKEERNIDGKLVRTTDALGAQAAHQHDAFERLVATRDALQNSVVTQYDGRGRKVATSDPDTGLWTYDHDAVGKLVWQQSPNQHAVNRQTTMAYDLLGRMVTRTEPEYVSNWVYDNCSKGVGKLCESSTGSGVSRKFAYDAFGRLASSRTNASDGTAFATAVGYDAANGRLSSQTYPTGLTVNYGYTAKGYLERLTLATAATVSPLPAQPGGTPAAGTTLPAGSVLWRALAYNAWGQVVRQRYGNVVEGFANFDPGTGRLASVTASLNGAGQLLNQDYLWDSLGRMRQRNDHFGDGVSGAVTESFSYDTLGRLGGYVVAAPAIPGLARSVSLQYNALGMLLSKSDVGAYGYGAQGPGATRPHALLSVTGADTTSYGYDGNGNLTSASAGKYRGIAYTSFNLPDSQSGIQGPGGSVGYTWGYDENHARLVEVRTTTGGPAAGTRTTWNLHPDSTGGLGFESEVNTPVSPSATHPAVTSNRHYLDAGGVNVGVLVSTGALPTLGASQVAPTPLATIALVKVEYWHKDSLGSLIATTDHAGAVTQRYAYDPFGKRRQANGSYDGAGNLMVDWSPATNNGTDRGFTGHEHLDDVGLVHMNGRIFDPTLGRFMQGDPLIQSPYNLQNYDRYGYCYNNPLSCRDPSGFSFLGDALTGWKDLMVDGWHFMWDDKLTRMAIIAAASYFTAGAAVDWYVGEVVATSGYAAGSVSCMSASAAAATTTAQVISSTVSGFTSAFLNSNGNLEEGFKGAALGSLKGVYGELLLNGAAGRMIGGGVNGYLQTGDVRGFARGFAASAAPNDLGFTSLYRDDRAGNIAIGILRDGIKGMIVEDSQQGFAHGVQTGQAHNLLGHTLGILSTGGLPQISDGIFFYGGRAAGNAITLGNVVNGPDGIGSPGFSDQLFERHERFHVTAQMEQGFGALYGAFHLTDLAIGWSVRKLGISQNGGFLLEEHLHEVPYSELDKPR
jgi:RHS repeat-associated protein